MRRLRPVGLGFNREFLIQSFKITASVVIAWLLATAVILGSTPIYAPITACFVAVATVRATFHDATQRVVAVVAGIALAYFIGSTLGLRVWTIAVVVGIGLLVGKALRLPRGAATQVPISGLLIMAVGTTPGHAGERIIETLIGAGVSVLLNLVIAPPNHVTAGSRAVADLVETVVAVTTDMAGGISARWTRSEAWDWLLRARANGTVAEAAEQAVDAGADSLRLRPASERHQLDQTRIDAAMDTLRVIEIQIRVVARSLRDTADALADASQTVAAVPMGADLLAVTAEAISAYGSSVLEPDPRERASARTQAAELVDTAAATAVGISRDIADMTATDLIRGLHLGALVIETGRVLDELRSGLGGRPEIGSSKAAHPPGNTAPDPTRPPDVTAKGGEDPTGRAIVFGSGAGTPPHPAST